MLKWFYLPCNRRHHQHRQRVHQQHRYQNIGITHQFAAKVPWSIDAFEIWPQAAKKISHLRLPRKPMVNVTSWDLTKLAGGFKVFNPSEKICNRQIGSFPQVWVKIKNIWNHHPEILEKWQLSPWVCGFSWMIRFSTVKKNLHGIPGDDRSPVATLTSKFGDFNHTPVVFKCWECEIHCVLKPCGRFQSISKLSTVRPAKYVVWRTKIFRNYPPPPRIPVTTRDVPFLIGNPNLNFKPSFVTIASWGLTETCPSKLPCFIRLEDMSEILCGRRTNGKPKKTKMTMENIGKLLLTFRRCTYEQWWFSSHDSFLEATSHP